MRFTSGATALLFALCCADSVLAARPFDPRDGPSSSPTQTTSPAPSTTDSSSSSASKTDASSSNASSSSSITSASTSASSPTPTPTDLVNVTSSTPAPTPTAPANATAPDDSSDELPLQPVITPAMAISGVVLLISGSVLCLVGIKHKPVHVFLSTALLTALAVTVLIIYVMNPPVSNAIQAAYMVAAIVTGLVFGGISIIFRDVTEGLGCLLGGFCLSMWFLVLKPGGLITSTAGRAILIAAFTVAAFSLSFSQYTRNYGLIACTAFAGAQVAMIGIDCFSRAGLKEFWIYLWALNDNEFPLNTNTYPITRGIRVEIACTVVLCLFGVLSQLKIWKIVKERRALREAERLQDDENRDILERECGEKIEKINRKDLRRWETLYGNKNAAASQSQYDSGVGSSIHTSRKSASTEAREVDDIELANYPGNVARLSKRESGPTVTVRPSSEFGIPNSRALPETNDTDDEWARSVKGASGFLDGEQQVPVRVSVQETPADDKPARESGPAVVPLPFSIPGEHHADAAFDNASIASRSVRHSAMKEDENDFVFDIPHVDEDQATSVAANADDIANMDTLSQHRLSMFPSPYDIPSTQATSPFASDVPGLSPETPASPNEQRMSFIEAPVEENDDEAIIRPPTMIEDRPLAETSQAKIRPESKMSIHSVGSLDTHLPRSMSRVAMTYRTNEWAKHITEAEEPQFADAMSSSPGIQVDPIFAQEAARPVDMEALQETPTQPVAVYEPQRSASQLSSRNPYRNSADNVKPVASNRNSKGPAPTPIYSSVHGRKNSSTVLNRSASNNTLRGDFKAQRNATTPMSVAPITEMPVSEAALARPAGYPRGTPVGFGSTTNLLDERNDRIKNMPRTTSFNALTSSTPNLHFIAPSDAASVQEMALAESPRDMSTPVETTMTFDEEDMTLAQRKALIRASSQVSHARPPTAEGNTQSPMHGRRTSVNSYTGAPSRVRSNSHQIASMNNPNLIYDSHQPQRGTAVDTTKQANMLAQWRQSLETSATHKQPLAMHDTAHNTMLLERRQKEWAAQQRQAEQTQRQSAIDMAMRTGQMNNAHRDAMRRMQAKANRESQG